MADASKQIIQHIDDPLERLLAVMARLRDPNGGCPWDLEQTFRTIAPYTIEEAYEVAEAIERADMPALKEELGDLLLQVVYHARMAEEEGSFNFHEVAGAIADKMIRRHPHVFGEAEVRSAEEQTRHWEDLKEAERRSQVGIQAEKTATEETGALQGVAHNLPALTRAVKLQRRAARVGFDWPLAEQVLDKIEEECGELRAELRAGSHSSANERIEDEVGDLLFAVANLARHLELDPESALRRCNAKFTRRFRAIEDALATFGRKPRDASLEEMETLWVAAKEREKRQK